MVTDDAVCAKANLIARRGPDFTVLLRLYVSTCDLLQTCLDATWFAGLTTEYKVRQ